MIDKTKIYWMGDSADDISEWLCLNLENESIDVKPVTCHACRCDSFELRVDQNDGTIQVKCTSCGTKKILLECGDV